MNTMDELLNEVVPQEDLERFEKKYNHELELDGEVTTETKFEYSFCLGIMILEELARTHPDGRRDYIYYLAFGNARIKEYTSGLKYCRAFLDIESNDQVRSLESEFQEYIKKQSDKEVAKGMAVAGGAALVLGGILGLGIAMAKNKQKREKK
ncbi:mitochondrial fission 1 protein isoform X3 [Drosophila rhopaloa]|uniref:Mitochondrial fission 1 protein isoform X3 n=1 Tax=Drosophila rhopaloa TaxID=1041015 RepID=A0A6P4DXN0_DRORH|nr:mitochondrial fission 1 protein isoform X3 [Drosophila rhopaloa]